VIPSPENLSIEAGFKSNNFLWHYLRSKVIITTTAVRNSIAKMNVFQPGFLMLIFNPRKEKVHSSVLECTSGEAGLSGSVGFLLNIKSAIYIFADSLNPRTILGLF
jgi:hypothetical protein